MPNSPKSQMRYFHLRTRLPTKYYAAIGRIITRWAIIEYKLAHMIFLALGITQEEGRLTLRGQRATERTLVLKDILELKDVSIKINWKKLRETLDEMESFRNRLAHNVWVHHPDTNIPVIQDLSAAYVKDMPPGHRPKINPLAVQVRLEKLQNLIANMNDMIKTLTEFERRLVHALQSSPQKPLLAPDPALLVPRRRKTRPKRRAPPQSSQG